MVQCCDKEVWWERCACSHYCVHFFHCFVAFLLYLYNCLEGDVSFVGMVLPGDQLTVKIHHIGMSEITWLSKWRSSMNVMKVLNGTTDSVAQATIIYIFTGQGSQEPGMDMDLYNSSPAAHVVWDDADPHLRADSFPSSSRPTQSRRQFTSVVFKGQTFASVTWHDLLHIVFKSPVQSSFLAFFGMQPDQTDNFLLPKVLDRQPDRGNRLRAVAWHYLDRLWPVVTEFELLIPKYGNFVMWLVQLCTTATTTSCIDPHTQICRQAHSHQVHPHQVHPHTSPFTCKSIRTQIHWRPICIKFICIKSICIKSIRMQVHPHWDDP